MPLCRELHLATVEIKTGGLVEDTYQRLIVDDQTTEELGKRSEPFGVSCVEISLTQLLIVIGTALRRKFCPIEIG